jgi:hypothetical protein
VLLLAVGLTMPLAAQGSRYHVLTELGAGMGLDLFVRGPWIAPTWRRSMAHRLVLAVGLNAFYEYVLEPWNDHPQGGRARDFQLRLGGTVLAEVVIARFRR